MIPEAASQAQGPQYTDGSVHQGQQPLDQVSTQRTTCRQKGISSNELGEGIGRVAKVD